MPVASSKIFDNGNWIPINVLVREGLI
jgi:hypothetical protein